MEETVHAPTSEAADVNLQVSVNFISVVPVFHVISAVADA
jgi:hypothetical protein